MMLSRSSIYSADTPISTIQSKLHIHCQEGQSESVDQLLQKHPDLINSKSSSGSTLLITAIKKKDLSEVRYLISMGADVNLTNNVF